LPMYSGGLSEVVRAPRYSTAVGLLISEMEQRKRNEHSRLAPTNIKGVMERMATWFKGNF
jgi:cell division protein FtsA